MRIVVDTSIVFGDFHLTGTNFKLLIDSARRTGDSIYFPQVVVDEIKNKYLEQLKSIKSKIDKEISSINRLTNTVSGSPISEEFVAQEARKYNEHLDAKILESGITKIPYSTISHERLVGRALQRKRPFTEGGKGYRDALIWENIKSVIPSQPRIDSPNVILITADNDFGDEKTLHKDLLEDLESSQLNSGSIKIIMSLNKFNEIYITPQLELLNTLKFRLKSGVINEIEFDEEIRNRVKSFIDEKDFEPSELDLRDEYEEIAVQEIIKDDIEYIINEVRKVSENELLIEVSATVKSLVSFFIFKADYYSLPEDVSPSVYDHDWNDHYVACEEEHKFNLDILMTVDSGFTEITSMEIQLKG